MAELGRSSLAVELDGAIYFVNLPRERMRILIQMASSLSDDGKLPVVPAPADYQFMEITRTKDTQ